MKNRLIYILVFLGFLLSSCNKWLDVKPKTKVNIDEMFESGSGFENALTACYIKLNDVSVYGKRLTATDIEYLAQHWDLDPNNMTNEISLKNFEYDKSYPQTVIDEIYSSLYNIIAQANIITGKIATNGDVITDPKTRAVIEAEALAIRAFCHTDILRLFGQMPTDAQKQISLPYQEMASKESVRYYSFTDFVAKIIADIEKAEKLLEGNDPILLYNFKQLDNFASDKSVELSNNFLGYRRFRFNYYSLIAMKARLYLYVGEKSKANESAKKIIQAMDRENNPILSLAGSDDFSKSNFALPSECILALSNFEITENFKNLFSPSKLYLNKNKLDNDLFAGQLTSTNNRYSNIWDVKTANNLGIITPIIRKYKQPAKDEFNSNVLATEKQVIPLIRLSEIYLIAIETANSIGEANLLYDTYMRARNILNADPLTESTLTNTIISEYRREFFAEGQMFYTYKRLGVSEMLWKTDREVTENDYVLPLPKSEINYNK